MGVSRKILLLGRAATGKTSMRTIVFGSVFAEDTKFLKATMDFEYIYINFMNSVLVTLVDCGGQSDYLESYLTRQRSIVFDSSHVLVYLISFDSDDIDQEIYFYAESLAAVLEYSQNPNIFLLFNKSDLIVPHLRQEFFDRCHKKFSELTYSKFEMYKRPASFTCLQTSIFDESIYNAWSIIMHSIMPNLNNLYTDLAIFGKLIDAEQAVLLERTSLLVVSNYSKEDDLENSENIIENNNFNKYFKNSPNSLDKNMMQLKYSNNQNLSIKDLKKSIYSEKKTETNSEDKKIATKTNTKRLDIVCHYLKRLRDMLRVNHFGMRDIEIKLANHYVSFYRFTENTYLMLVTSNKISELGLNYINSQLIRSRFEMTEVTGRRSNIFSF